MGRVVNVAFPAVTFNVLVPKSSEPAAAPVTVPILWVNPFPRLKAPDVTVRVPVAMIPPFTVVAPAPFWVM